MLIVIFLTKLRHIDLERLVFDLYYALKLKNVFQQEINQTHCRLVLDFFVLIDLASNSILFSVIINKVFLIVELCGLILIWIY